MTVDEAVALVKSGDLIVHGHGNGQPNTFGPALMKRTGELRDVRLSTGYNMGDSPHCEAQYEGIFKNLSIFNIGPTRQAHWAGRADFDAAIFSQLEQVYTSWKPRVLFTHVTPPDENGFVSMGVSMVKPKHGSGYKKRGRTPFPFSF
jgi:4-hydroxybutyrate CoA-transferase